MNNYRRRKHKSLLLKHQNKKHNGTEGYKAKVTVGYRADKSAKESVSGDVRWRCSMARLSGISHHFGVSRMKYSEDRTNCEM